MMNKKAVLQYMKRYELVCKITDMRPFPIHIRYYDQFPIFIYLQINYNNLRFT